MLAAMKSVVLAAAVLCLFANPVWSMNQNGQWAKFRPALRIERAFRPLRTISPAYDLRPKIKNLGLAIRDQGDRGTCSVFATTFIIEFAEATARSKSGLYLSEEYLNWALNAANHLNQDGGFFSLIINGYQSFGMVNEAQMPYRPNYNSAHPDTPSQATINAGRSFDQFPISFIKDWNHDTGLTPREFDAIKAAIRAGTPVASGIWWLNDFETVTVDSVPILKEYPRSANIGSNPPMFDGHSIDLVGYHEASAFPGGGYFIFRNIFGTGFGDDGYGFVSFKYIRDYANDAIEVTGGPIPPQRPTRPNCRGTKCF